MTLETRVQDTREKLPDSLKEDSHFEKPWVGSRFDGFYFPCISDAALAVALFASRNKKGSVRRIAGDMVARWNLHLKPGQDGLRSNVATAESTLEYVLNSNIDTFTKHAVLSVLTYLGRNDYVHIEGDEDIFGRRAATKGTQFENIDITVSKEKGEFGGYLLRIRDSERRYDAGLQFPRDYESLFVHLWKRSMTGEDKNYENFWTREQVRFSEEEWDTMTAGGNLYAATVHIPITLQEGGYFQVSLDAIAKLFEGTILEPEEIIDSLSMRTGSRCMFDKKREFAKVKKKSWLESRRRAVADIGTCSAIDGLELWKRSNWLKIAYPSKKIIGRLPPEKADYESQKPELVITLYYPGKYGAKSGLSVSEVSRLETDAFNLRDNLKIA